MGCFRDAMVLSGCIAVASCGGGPADVEPEAVPSVAGAWEGQLEGQPRSFVLQEGPERAVTGDARLQRAGPVADALFRITGLYTHPDLVLQLESSCALCPVSPPWRFEGTVSEDRLQGVLTREGLPDQGLVLTRR